MTQNRTHISAESGDKQTNTTLLTLTDLSQKESAPGGVLRIGIGAITPCTLPQSPDHGRRCS